MSPGERRNVMGFKPTSQLTQRAQLWLVVLLTLFIGMGFGFLLATGFFLDIWGGLADVLGAPAGGGGEVFLVLLGWVYTVLIAKPLFLLVRRFPPGFFWALGILVVAFSVVTKDPNVIVGAWLFVITVIAMGTPPFWLTLTVGSAIAVALYLFEAPYGIFAVPIVAMGFLRYPTGISARRFLFPSRGVM